MPWTTASTPARSVTCGARIKVRIPAKRGITCASSGRYGGPATARAYSVPPPRRRSMRPGTSSRASFTRSEHRVSTLGSVGLLGGRVLAVLVLAVAVAGGAQGATYANGVDVSHWQGRIQWLQVASASYTFAFGKATEGKTLVDPTYSINRSGAQTVGLRFGAYHFARPAGSGAAAVIANAIAQADFFLDVAQPQAGELPPVLDLETKGGLPTAALQTWTSAW